MLPCFTNDFCSISDQQAECGVCVDFPCPKIEFTTFGIDHSHVCGSLQERTNLSGDLVSREYYLTSGSTVVWRSLNIDERIPSSCTQSSGGSVVNSTRCYNHRLLGHLEHTSDNDVSLLACGDPVVAVTEIQIYIK